MRLVPLSLLVLPAVLALKCNNYTEEQQGGKIMTSDKTVVNCITGFCFIMKREGGQDDLDVYGCSDPTTAAYTCTANGTTTTNSGGIYTRLTCCGYDLCNSSQLLPTLLIISLFLLLL